MLDPLTAIGLVGNIVQFIDFGCKIVSKTTETYRAADGSLKENTDLEIVANDLISINAILTTSSALAIADPSLNRLCTSCVEVATHLIALLVKLRAGKDPTKWRSVRKALRSICSKDKISALEARLGEFRDEVNLRIVVSLRGQIEALILQQSDRFDTLDDRSKIIVDAIRSSQDIFSASLQTQTQSLKAIVEESELRLRDDQVTARDEIIAAVDDTAQNSQLEYQANREEIAQIKLALQQLSEQIERKNDELRDVLSKFSAATTTQKKQKFQDLSRAITLTLLALETVYRSLRTLLANIQSRSVVFLSQSTVRQLWGFRPHPNRTGAKPAPVESCLELATNPARVVEYAIMRYYVSYYFPYFVAGATYSYHYQNGLINPRIHARWPNAANDPTGSPYNRSGSETYHQQALDLLDLVVSGSSAGPNSSKAYAFVWLMAIINSVPDELFPAPGGRYLLFETVFSRLNNDPSARMQQHKDTDGGSSSLHARLQQDLEVWKATAELTGLSEACRNFCCINSGTIAPDHLLDASEDNSLAGASAHTSIFQMTAVKTDELSRFFLWLITDMYQGGESIQYAGGLIAEGERYHFLKREGLDSMGVTYESTYQVARFFQKAGIVMAIYRKAIGNQTYFGLVKNDEDFTPVTKHIGSCPCRACWQRTKIR